MSNENPQDGSGGSATNNSALGGSPTGGPVLGPVSKTEGGAQTSGGGKLTDRQILGALVQAGWKEAGIGGKIPGGVQTAVLPAMIGIAIAESDGDPRAHNSKPPDDSYGLWQINMYGNLGPGRRQQFGISSNEQLYDPVTNAKAAKAIYDSQGIGAWSTYKSGAYLKYAGRGMKAVAEGANDPGVAEANAPNAGTNILDPLSLFQNLFGWIFKQIGMPIALFLGGGVLIILALVLFANKQGIVPGPAKLVKKVL